MIGYRVTMVTNLWVWLGRCFQKGLPEEGRPTLKMGSNTHGLGSWVELKGEREKGSMPPHPCQ